MADEDRAPPDALSFFERLAEDPGSFDFHVALRRFEAAFPELPRLGEAARPAEEPLRIGQLPSSTFEAAAIERFEPGGDGAPARLFVAFLGLWGPQGPMPGHLTEYARERARHAGDHTLARFVDVFHHRMLLLFHRAWAQAQPTAARDRAGADAFAPYLGAFLGLGLASTRGRDALPDREKLFFAGRFAAGARSAEGLADILSAHLGVRATVESFVGEWLDIPAGSRWGLDGRPETGLLGRTTVLGGRVWSRTHKFRVRLGPLSREELARTLPSAKMLAELTALVRLYTNDEWSWDLCLTLAADATEPLRLGGAARLGWTARLGAPPDKPIDLIVDPATRRTRRAPATPY